LSVRMRCTLCAVPQHRWPQAPWNPAG
jgi:hypothetical protein